MSSGQIKTYCQYVDNTELLRQRAVPFWGCDTKTSYRVQTHMRKVGKPHKQIRFCFSWRVNLDELWFKLNFSNAHSVNTHQQNSFIDAVLFLTDGVCSFIHGTCFLVGNIISNIIFLAIAHPFIQAKSSFPSLLLCCYLGWKPLLTPKAISQIRFYFLK